MQSSQSSAAPRIPQRRQGSTPEPSTTTSTSTSAMDQQQQQQQQQGQQQVGQARSTSGASAAASVASRGHSSKSSNPDKQISQIEKSVTHLLVATKQLLETLTQWSRSNAQEEEVSDVYVRLGYEFNLACRAFNSIGVDTSDLGPVPDLLRTILEETLSQPASPQALDNYLPRIRDIIINLLQGLKRKQAKLRRPVNTKDGGGAVAGKVGPSRQGSVVSQASDGTGVTLVDNGPIQQVVRENNRRHSPSSDGPSTTTDSLPPPPTSGLERRGSLRRSIRREPGQQIPSSDSSSTTSTATAETLPVIAPPQQDSSTAANFPHAPPPPPKQDALTALQRGGDLERRASRRFSSYQISKHLGASPHGVPMIPPAQNSPAPNRGRELRESMRAVTSRTTSYQAARQKSSPGKSSESPTRTATIQNINRISEEREDVPDLETRSIPRIEPPKEHDRDDSPIAKTPDEYRRGPLLDTAGDQVQLGATVDGPFSPSKESLGFSAAGGQVKSEHRQSPIHHEVTVDSPARTPTASTVRPSATPPPASTTDLDSSPVSSRELTLFLQYKTRIKKFVLPTGDDMSLARLQLAFIEKFAWNTHGGGAALPEIYIQDPISGVRHELEDLSDVKDRSVLVLNFEVLDEVKKHFDEGIGGLRTTLEGVRSLLDGQSTLMHRFGDRQLEASKEMARISTVPTPRRSRAPTIDFDKAGMTPSRETEEQLTEVANLRRDIAVLRQTYSSMSADFAASMADIKAKAANVKSAAANAAVPSYEGSAGRAHVNAGKQNLTNDSEALVNRVDNLADTVEELRKDVVSRGVRPRPRDLELLSKEIASVSQDLSRVKEFIKREKPIWTKIWEQELNLVCTERDDLTQQEELVGDLVGDLGDVQNVFDLVEEAMKQQNLQGPGSLRQTTNLRPVEIDTSMDPGAAKVGVLDEVRALRPNHENRLEAIERAEAQRKRDLEARVGNEFQKEVEQFVEEGKLKRTGGMEEVERLREVKEERARRENWVTQQKIEEEKARKRAEREAAKAAARREAEVASTNSDVDIAREVPLPAPTPAPSGHDRSDTSQEGDAAFLDAPTGMTPQVTPSVEIDEPPPPPLPSKDDVGAPQLPQISVSGEGGGSDVKDVKTNDNPWWKPAVF